MVFINSLLPAKYLNPNSVIFDDYSEITDDIVAEINEVAESITIEFP